MTPNAKPENCPSCPYCGDAADVVLMESPDSFYCDACVADWMESEREHVCRCDESEESVRRDVVRAALLRRIKAESYGSRGTLFDYFVVADRTEYVGSTEACEDIVERMLDGSVLLVSTVSVEGVSVVLPRGVR